MAEIFSKDIEYKFEITMNREDILDFALLFCLDAIHDIYQKSYNPYHKEPCTEFVKIIHIDLIIKCFQSLFFADTKGSFTKAEIESIKKEIMKLCSNKKKDKGCLLCAFENKVAENRLDPVSDIGVEHDYEYVDTMYVRHKNAYIFSYLQFIEYNGGLEKVKIMKHHKIPKHLVKYVECKFNFIDNNNLNKPSIIYKCDGNYTDNNIFMIKNNNTGNVYYNSGFGSRIVSNIIMEKMFTTRKFQYGEYRGVSNIDLKKMRMNEDHQRELNERIFRKFMGDFGQLMIYKALSKTLNKKNKKILFYSQDRLLKVIAKRFFDIDVYEYSKFSGKDKNKIAYDSLPYCCSCIIQDK